MRTLLVIAFSFGVCLSASPASAETCSEAIAHCKQDGSRHPDADAKCTAAGNACMKTGSFIGPYTHKLWRGFVKQ
ncbi:hypothetical protein [Bradyrhizobium betae]|uniref:Uncharacterized protein n=1 Tax=Bradyrhizobium betae TaxID=244734 RepID=A0A5P6P9M6_9BRAD|nr:hypothetical protein [Bradyrhizobium betae]MCS3727339.1 hypothetical protein [Bradyrhizobium betae]QFI74768.1 hypothetical protein F8237_21555 [Bradyrhizobium betae]